MYQEVYARFLTLTLARIARAINTTHGRGLHRGPQASAPGQFPCRAVQTAHAFLPALGSRGYARLHRLPRLDRTRFGTGSPRPRVPKEKREYQPLALCGGLSRLSRQRPAASGQRQTATGHPGCSADETERTSVTARTERCFCHRSVTQDFLAYIRWNR